MWWCHWTRHTWFPIDIYINYMFNSLHLALLAPQNVSYLLSSGPNYEKSQEHRMTSKWPWTLKGQRYPLYVEVLPASPKFHSVCSTIARFPDIEVFDFSIGYNGEFAIFEKEIVKNQKLKISKISNILLWGPLGGKFRTSFKTFGCDL